MASPRLPTAPRAVSLSTAPRVAPPVSMAPSAVATRGYRSSHGSLGGPSLFGAEMTLIHSLFRQPVP
eukprot:2305658-Pleurochrysis_carterae.AAC.1